MMRKLLTSESGVILPMALILLLAGSILIVPLLHSVSTGLLISQRTGFADSGDYSGDAGIEDAIWDLTFDDLADDIPNKDDSTTYEINAPINGETVSVTVTNLGTVLASDNLESNSWTGGTGWLNSWSSSGMTSVTSAEQAQEGDYHIRLRAVDGAASRQVDLFNQPPGVKLQFWARIKIFEEGDEVELKLSPDGQNWTELFEWDMDDSDDIYYFRNIDLTGITLSNQTRIKFDADLDNGGDKFFIDDINIIRPPTYEIVVNVGGILTTSVVSIDQGQVTVLSWEQG